jgi:hypothetical protein
MNEVTEADGFKRYARVCSTDLCNDWDGIAPSPIRVPVVVSEAAAVDLEAVGVVIDEETRE